MLAADTDGLRLIQFRTSKRQLEPDSDWREDDNDILRDAKMQLDEYFAGGRRDFDLPLSLIGTEFQKRVWLTLAKIPWGSTFSYKELATHIGKPTATRAVGAANGRNPIPIVLPCHRVIGADGSLTGFGGGLPAKRWLLQHEGALPSDDLFG